MTAEVQTGTKQQGAPDRRSRTLFPNWLRITVSIGLLVVLLSSMDLGESWSVVSAAHVGYVILAFALMMADRFLAAYRWYLLIADTTPDLKFTDVLRVFFVSNFLGTFMPGTVGIEVMRVYGLARVTADSALSVSSVLVERALALLTLFVLVLVGVIASPLALPPAVGHLATAGLAILGLICVAAMHRRIRSLTHVMLPGAKLEPVRVWLDKLYASLDTYKAQPRMMLRVTVLTIIFQFLRIATVVVAAWALHIHAPLMHFILTVPICIFAQQLPISIGGLGVREMGYVYFMSLVGIGSESAFALSLFIYFAVMLTVVPGAWLYARQPARR